MGCARRAYLRDGFTVSEKKTFGFGSLVPLGEKPRALVNFTHWGSEIRGKEGDVGAPLEKRMNLAMLAFRSASLSRLS